MNNQSLIFDRIIRGDLRPWLDKNKHDEKFAPMIGNLKLIDPRFNVLYEIDFYRYFSCKTKYYHKLIVNESTNYCNGIIELINSDEEIHIKKYWIGRTLKKIKTLLREAAKIIHANDYELEYINPYQCSFDTDRDHKSDTYFIQLLKTVLLKVYLEIQDVFKSYVPEADYMEIEDMYLHVLSDPIPEQTFLKHQIAPETIAVGAKSDPAEMDKVSKINPNSFKFDRYETNPDALNDLLNSLKLYFLVDKKSFNCDFKKIFSGKEITNPIRWTGNDSEFYWFVYLIYTKYKFVEDLRQQQWKVACHCFIRADGSRFDPAKLRNLKRPRLTGAVIEKAVKLLK